MHEYANDFPSLNSGNNGVNAIVSSKFASQEQTAQVPSYDKLPSAFVVMVHGFTNQLDSSMVSATTQELAWFEQVVVASQNCKHEVISVK